MGTPNATVIGSGAPRSDYTLFNLKMGPPVGTDASRGKGTCTDRQTDRQADKQIHAHVHACVYTQIDTHRETETDIYKYTNTDIHAYM